jgi:L-ascorbate metabolism protein UlaG (beta-lactamase superfamily)
MKIKYLGHSAVLIQSKNFKVLIDPFLKGNPQYINDKNDIQDITHIFITHGHQDHVGDAIEIALKNNSIIIANSELVSLLKTKHPTLKVHPMHIGGTFNFPFGKVKMTPAAHGSTYKDSDGIHNAGNPGGFLITIDKKILYHAGDTGLIYDMKLLKDDHVDIAFLPIGGNYTMDIYDAVKAVKFIKPKMVIPMHYNTFDLIQADPFEFKKLLTNYTVKILQPSMELEV